MDEVFVCEANSSRIPTVDGIDIIIISIIIIICQRAIKINQQI